MCISEPKQHHKELIVPIRIPQHSLGYILRHKLLIDGTQSKNKFGRMLMHLQLVKEIIYTPYNSNYSLPVISKVTILALL